MTLVERKCTGSCLVLNDSCAPEGGAILVELVEPPRSPAAPVQPLPGFSLAEAVPLRGDEVAGVVSWEGTGSDLSALAGRNVSVRLHLVRAKVFAVGL